MKNIIKVIMVIMGTLIGAGFASGREIYLFFTKYGVKGEIGIIISGIFTIFIIYLVLNLIKKENIKNYQELLNEGNLKNNKIKKIIKIINLIINSFLIISFFIMVAGFCAYIKQSYEIDTYFSSILFILICFIVFKKDIQGVTKINTYLVPILLILILFLGIKNIPYLMETNNSINITTEKNIFLISSILYTSYNSIILIPILVSMKKYIKNDKEIKLISIISGILIILLSFCIFGLLLKGQYYIEELELPLLKITLQYGKIYKYIYSFIIIVSIFTSAVSTGYSFLENVSKNKKEYNKNLLLISILGILISNVGFSNLVKILYPIFGVLGLIQIIFLYYIKCYNIKRNNMNILEKIKKN